MYVQNPYATFEHHADAILPTTENSMGFETRLVQFTFWLGCNNNSVLDSALFNSQNLEFCQLISFDHYT